MNAYRVYLADGTDYVTSMNATLAEARVYFCNREINTGAAEDNMVKVQHVDHADRTETIKCPRCGMDSGTAHWHKANAWWRCHIALTCRGERTQAPCVNSDARQ
jgi:hypothetical protein